MLIVAFEDDLLTSPSQLHKLVAARGNHVVQPADVCVDVEGLGFRRGLYRRSRTTGRPLVDNGGNMLLHVAAETFPPFVGTAQSRKVMEIGVLGSDALEILLVVDFRFVTRTVHQPE